MAKEILAIPEQHLEEVIEIIRNGLKNTDNVSDEVEKNLTKWCHEKEEYLKLLKSD